VKEGVELPADLRDEEAGLEILGALERLVPAGHDLLLHNARARHRADQLDASDRLDEAGSTRRALIGYESWRCNGGGIGPSD